MSKSKNTRSSKVKNEDGEAGSKASTLEIIKKIFYVDESLLKNSEELSLERFYHPGKGSSTLFIVKGNEKIIMEVIEFTEPRRSWLVNSDICSNGRIYITTPIDSTFLALHHLRKHCSQKALALDSIHDEKDSSVNRLLTKLIDEKNLSCVADIKKSGDMVFFKYNPERTLAWLAIKTRRTVEALKKAAVHCGHSSVSENYGKSDKVADEQVSDVEYLRMACDIVGSYIDYDVHEELIKYLDLPSEIQGEKSAVQKRKSLQALNAKDNKKIKMDGNSTGSGVTDKLKDSDLLDDSVEESKTNSPPQMEYKAPPKEKVLTAKEKALAKGAKGTKSIASFFQKK